MGNWHPQKSEPVSVTCPKCGRIVMKSRLDGKTRCSYCALEDKKIYFKIERLFFDESDCIGIFYRGHIDMEQWKRVATDYMKTEYEIESGLEFRKGWYKVLPNRKMKLISRQVKGSFPAMECIYA